jgi:hypothetical protein
MVERQPHAYLESVAQHHLNRGVAMWRNIVLACLLVTGCSPRHADVDDTDGATGENVGTSEQAFTKAQAKLVGKALGAGIQELTERLDPITPDSTTGDSKCWTLSGDTSDDDGDRIPADAELTLDCSKRRLGFTGTLTGVETVTDREPDALAWAFDATVDAHSTLTGPFGGSMVLDAGGTVVASQQSIVGPFHLDGALDIATLITNVRGIETQILEGVDLTMSYTPDFEWAPGEVAIVGRIDVEGEWNVSIDDIAAAATLQTPTPLTFDPTCKTGITAGQLEAALTFGERAATIWVDWSGCGSPTVDYDLSPASTSDATTEGA